MALEILTPADALAFATSQRGETITLHNGKTVTLADGKTIPLHDGGGTYLTRHGRYDTTSMVFRYQRAGKGRLLGLGGFAAKTLPEARAALAAGRKGAAEARTVLRNGDDPIDARRAEQVAKRAREGALPRGRGLADAATHHAILAALEGGTADEIKAAVLAALAGDAKKGMTFNEACDGYLADHASKWTAPRAEKDWKVRMDSAKALIGDMPVATIGGKDVLGVLRPLWKAQAPKARKLASAMRDVFAWAIGNEHRKLDNPVSDGRALVAALGAQGHKVEHHAHLDPEHCPALWRALEAKATTAAAALRFALATGSRAAEVLQMTWGEVDLAAEVWTIPAARFKSRRAVRIPLSSYALAILKARPSNRDGGSPVFAKPDGGCWAGWGAADEIDVFLKGVDPAGKATAHGTCRASLKTWALAQGVAPHIAEALLDHKLGDATAQAYDRQDFAAQRLEVFEQWGTYLTTGP